MASISSYIPGSSVGSGVNPFSVTLGFRTISFFDFDIGTEKVFERGNRGGFPHSHRGGEEYSSCTSRARGDSREINSCALCSRC